MQRKFIWREEGSSRRRHAVAWKQLCKSKQHGGVGVKNLKLMNEAFLMKILWNFKTKPDELWVQVLRGKYGRGKHSGTKNEAKQGDSKLWKNLSKLEDKMEPFVSLQDQELV